MSREQDNRTLFQVCRGKNKEYPQGDTRGDAGWSGLDSCQTKETAGTQKDALYHLQPKEKTL